MRYLLLLVPWCFIWQFSFAALNQKETIREKLTITFSDKLSQTYSGEQLKTLLRHCALLAELPSKSEEITLGEISFQEFSQFLLIINANMNMIAKFLSIKSLAALSSQLKICTNMKATELTAIILEICVQKLTSENMLESLIKNDPLEKKFSPTQEKQIAHAILKKIVMPNLAPWIQINKKNISLSNTTDIAYNSDGSQLAIAADKHIHILNPVSLQLIHKDLGSHKDSISMLAFNPSNQYELASSSLDSTVKLWNTLTGKLHYEFVKHKRPVNCVSYTEKTEQIISGDQQGVLYIWSIQEAKILISCKHKDPESFNIRVVAYDPAAGKIIYGNLDGFKVLKLNSDKQAILESKIGTDISKIPDLCFAAKKLLMYTPARNHFSFDSECTKKIHAHNPLVEQKQQIDADKHTIVIHDNSQIIPSIQLDLFKDPVGKLMYHPGGNQIASLNQSGSELALVDLSQVNNLFTAKIGTNLNQAMILSAALTGKFDVNKIPQHLETETKPLKQLLDVIKNIKMK